MRDMCMLSECVGLAFPWHMVCCLYKPPFTTYKSRRQYGLFLDCIEAMDEPFVLMSHPHCKSCFNTSSFLITSTFDSYLSCRDYRNILMLMWASSFLLQHFKGLSGVCMIYLRACLYKRFICRIVQIFPISAIVFTMM